MLNKSKIVRIHGSIEFIFGCMNAGKTSEMMRRVRNARAAEKECLVIKYAGDTRFDEKKNDENLFTHNRDKIEAMPARNLMEVDEYMSKIHDGDFFEVIGVDEIQFFAENTMDILLKWKNAGKRVICSGLNLNARCVPWPIVVPLIFKADKVTQLLAICKRCCKNDHEERDATLTWAYDNETGEEKIGGAEAYCAVCSTCWDELEVERLESKKSLLLNQ